MTIRNARGRFTTTSAGTVDDIGHRPGTVVLDGDGVRHRTVRFAMFAPHTVTLVYTTGPSDVFRRGTVLTVVGPFAPYGSTVAEGRAFNDPRTLCCERDVADCDCDSPVV